MTIAFIGIDGSGKTTLSQKLKEELTKRGYSAVVTKPFDYLIFSPVFKIIKKIIVSSKDAKENPFLKKKNKLLLFRLWPFLALIDHWLYFLIKIKPLERKYDYVICDRFFFDFGTSFNYYGYTTNWLNNLYFKLIPKPDLTFVLDLSPEKARKREKKCAHSLEFFEFQRASYLDLAREFKLPKINSSLGVEKALERVLKKIGVN